MKPFRLSRRACLRGAGVALALPLLEAMEVPKAKAQAANPVRFLCVYSPNGFRMDKFTPAGSGGTNYTLSPLLAPLEPFKADMNVITGLGNYTASIYNAFGGSHTRSCGSLLTQCPIMAPETGAIGNGVSLDQVMAEKLKAVTRYPSIEVGGRANNATGNCEDQFSCAYNNNISWKNPTTPQVKQVNPRDVFNRFFKDLPTMQPSMPMENKDALYQKSILDVVLAHSEGLRGKLGKTDLAKLDQYLTSLREVEMRIARLVDGSVMGRECAVPTAPKDINMDNVPFDEHLDLLSDLVVLAFQCDIVRVGTMMYEHSFSDQRNFSFLGISAGHHQLTHEDTQNAAANEEKINAFYIARFKHLLEKMKAATEGDSNVLDNSIVYLTSEFGNAHIHDMRNLPMVVAGKAGGKFKTGQHVVYPLAPGAGTGGDGKGNRDDVQVARLHMSVLSAMDLPQPSFGHDDQNQPIATTGLSEIMA